MAAKKGTVKKQSTPRTARAARKGGYKPVQGEHPAKNKPEGFALVKLGSGAALPRIICYYNPNTGEWDDCHVVDG
jgi:hypothetical protein